MGTQPTDSAPLMEIVAWATSLLRDWGWGGAIGAFLALLFFVTCAIARHEIVELWKRCKQKKKGALLPQAAGANDLAANPQDAPNGSASLRKIWNVPFQRNVFFTGRETEIQAIHDAFSTQKMAAISQAVAGKGGIGKTQTAVEYAYRYQDEYAAVLWTKAETADDVVSGYAQIAAMLKLPLGGNPDLRASAAATMRWLEEHGDWLLVLDNADKPEQLKPFLPNRLLGHVLITSRADRFDILNILRPTHLDVLSPDDALAFLLKRVGCESPNEEQVEAAKAVAKRLGHLPLALEQASAFVLAKRCTFADYLAAYEKKGVALLGEQGPVTGDYEKTVLTTWAVNFTQVEEESPAAAELLRACAFLAPEPIPYSLILEGSKHFSPVVQGVLDHEPDNLTVSNLLAPLAEFSLVEINPEAHTFTLHRLVQEAVRHGLGREEGKKFANRIACALNAAFPAPDIASWPWCESLVSHTAACEEYITLFEIATKPAGELLGKAGKYAWMRARYPLAVQLAKSELAISEKVFGPEHPNTAASLNNLSEFYRTIGCAAEADPLLQRALAINEKTFGPEHPSLATNLNNLGSIHYAAGRLSEAESLFNRAAAIEIKANGPDHPSVSITLNNLAEIYRVTNRFAECEDLNQRCLAILEKALGPEHPNTAQSMFNLAAVIWARGRPAEAETLYRRALAIREKVLGPEHPDTGASYFHLGMLLHSTGSVSAGRQLLEKAANVRANHPYLNYNPMELAAAGLILASGPSPAPGN